MTSTELSNYLPCCSWRMQNSIQAPNTSLVQDLETLAVIPKRGCKILGQLCDDNHKYHSQACCTLGPCAAEGDRPVLGITVSSTADRGHNRAENPCCRSTRPLLRKKLFQLQRSVLASLLLHTRPVFTLVSFPLFHRHRWACSRLGLCQTLLRGCRRS